MSQTRNRLKSNTILSEPFEICSGVKQGDGLSPVVFILTLQYALRKTVEKHDNTIGIQGLQILPYADDIAIIGRNERDIEKYLKNLQQVTNELGLKLNDQKTEYLILNKDEEEQPSSVTLNNKEYKVVKEYKYLGSNINTANDIEEAFKTRPINSNKRYFSLNDLFKSKSIARNSKIKI